MEEGSGENHVNEESIKIPKRKVTMKYIQDKSLRKVCYKKRCSGLLKKITDITTVCGIDACAIIYGPDGAVPTVWPSQDEAKQLLQRFERIPEAERTKKMTSHGSIMDENVKKLKRQVDKIKETNYQREMQILLAEIFNGGKSIDDFDADMVRRLDDFIEESLKRVRKKISYLEKKPSDSNNNNSLPPLVIPSYTHGNGINGGVGNTNSSNNNNNNNNMMMMMMSNKMELVPSNTYSDGVCKELVQGSFGGLLSGSDSMMLSSGDFGGFVGGTSDSAMLSSGNFRVLNNGNGLGMLPQSSFREFNGGSGSNMLSLSNFGDFNGGNGSSMLPHTNFEGLLSYDNKDFNGTSKSELAPQNTFEVINAEIDRLILAQQYNNFGALPVENKLMGVPQFNSSRGINGEQNLGLLEGSSSTEIGGSSNWATYGFGNAIGGNGMRIQQNNENYIGLINNNIAGLQQYQPSNFGVVNINNNNNSGATMEEFNANFFGINNGGN